MDVFLDLRATLMHLKKFDDWSTELSYCVNAAQRLEGAFENRNSRLASGWQTVEDFLYKMDNTISSELELLYNDLNAYIEESRSIENKEQKVIEMANDSAKSILTELGIS